MRPSIRRLALPVLAAFSVAASAQDNNDFSSDLPTQDWASCTDTTRQGLISINAPVETKYIPELGHNELLTYPDNMITGRVEINCFRDERNPHRLRAIIGLHRGVIEAWNYIARKVDTKETWSKNFRVHPEVFANLDPKLIQDLGKTPEAIRTQAYDMTDEDILGDNYAYRTSQPFTVRTSEGVQDPETGCVTRLFKGSQEKWGLVFVGAYTHCPSVRAASASKKNLQEAGDVVESTVTETRAQGNVTYKLMHRQ